MSTGRFGLLLASALLNLKNLKGGASFRGSSVAILAMLFPLFILFIVTERPFNVYEERAIVFIYILTLTFLYFPLNRKRVVGRKIYSIIDGILIVALIVSGLHIALDYEYIVSHMGVTRPIDVVCGITAILVTLEATRRVMFPIALVCLVFLLYAFCGGHLGVLSAATPFDIDILVTHLYLSLQGLFGLVLNVAIKYIIPFIIMGSFLKVMGAMDVLGDFVTILVGKSTGGPAKISVVTSSFFGMISGSATANVVFTGTFTIPIMKRYGYRDSFAGAVEACASTGGQIMPPILGAAAFIMADYLAISYLRIALAALLPALLYYLALFLRVHYKAKEQGLEKPSADIMGKSLSLREIMPRLIPLIIMLTILLVGLVMWTPTRAAVVTTLALIPLSFLRRETWLTPGRILAGLRESTNSTMSIGAACVAFGILIGVVGMTGLGLKFASLMLIVSRESFYLLLLLTAIASIIMGMGVSSVAVYIFAVLMLAPALVDLGVLPLAAHFFVFYYAQLQALTPPVCMAAYTAAAIAGAKPIKTALTACSLGVMGFLLPFLSVLHPELLFEGSIKSSLIIFLFLAIGVLALTFALGGYLNRRLMLWERILFGLSAIVMFAQWGYTANLVVTVAIGALIFISMRLRGGQVLSKED